MKRIFRDTLKITEEPLALAAALLLFYAHHGTSLCLCYPLKYTI